MPNSINKQFLNACEKGDLTKVSYLLTSSDIEPHADIFHQDKNGWSGLVMACAKGHLHVVQYLLESKELTIRANVYQKTNSGASCFMYACFNQREEIIDYLLFDRKMLIDEYGLSVLNTMSGYESVLNKIQARNFHYDLNEKLPIQTQTPKIKKI